jgi:fumarate hydratase class II
MTGTRKETDSLGVVDVPIDKLWGAQTQRSLVNRRPKLTPDWRPKLTLLWAC